MNRTIIKMALFSAGILFLFSCKKSFDEYYQRPATLAPPIYQQLQSKGKFKTLLALIDKADYKETLNSAGYWTFFAPNDSAFTRYFQEKGIGGVDKIEAKTARAMVQYLLVYNSFTKETLDDFQSSTGWVPSTSFRRRTAYYTGFYDDTMQNGTAIKAIQSNRNGNSSPYASVDNNNKYITYFTDLYFNNINLTAADYTYFYPNSQYSDFNVGEAKVLTRDIASENGVIHELDRVVSPLPSIDEYLRTRPEYSEFKKLYDKYLVSFILNADATNRYKVLSGGSNQVYVKAYNSSLAFSLNNENYLKLQDNDGQQNCWTIFVPKNDVLLDYENKVLLEYYKTFDAAPTSILLDFLNAHMWQTPVWPSKFAATSNFVGEEARFNPQTDVIDRKILSNGFFYGTNKVQEANVFSTVYSRAYLDPKFSIMTRLLNIDLKFTVSYPNARFTFFLVPDAVLRAAGYDYNTSSNLYTFTAGTTVTSGEAIRQNLIRILNTSVISGDLADLSGSGIAEAYNGEYIKWNGNQIASGGTQDANQVVKVDSVRTTKNGKVYYLNGLLNFTTVNIGTHIKNLGGASAAASDFNYFANYLTSSGIYNATTGEITGTVTGTFYTVFVPTNAAIMQAVRDGLLPGTPATGAPNFTATTWTAAQREQVNNFILYHMLNKKTLVPNGKESGPFESMLKNAKGEVLPLTIISQQGSMQITDMNSRKANVIVAKSNNLSNRTVIHLIDNYLKFTY
ncbi:MAG: fasciclin domain-containing protein [Williamsia sp.]|nr:fasciclin domain-containing protein [Williamsia sp.]